MTGTVMGPFPDILNDIEVKNKMRGTKMVARISGGQAWDSMHHSMGVELDCIFPVRIRYTLEWETTDDETKPV